MHSVHEVSLDPAALSEQSLLSNLLELYIHDLSVIFPHVELGSDGRFGYRSLPLYWTEPDRRFPFVIRCAGRVAGSILGQRTGLRAGDPDVYARRTSTPGRRVILPHALTTDILRLSPRSADTMPEKKRAKKSTPKIAKSTTPSAKTSKRFTDEERAAMRERAQELKAAARPGPSAGKAGDDSAVLAKIATMPAPDRAMAERLHAIIKASAPGLSPKLWYGMPAYAKDGSVVCFFQAAQKFKTRYATLGFSDKATLDEGHMWPTAFALAELTADDEARIGALVKKAVS